MTKHQLLRPCIWPRKRSYLYSLAPAVGSAQLIVVVLNYSDSFVLGVTNAHQNHQVQGRTSREGLTRLHKSIDVGDLSVDISMSCTWAVDLEQLHGGGRLIGLSHKFLSRSMSLGIFLIAIDINVSRSGGFLVQQVGQSYCARFVLVDFAQFSFPVLLVHASGRPAGRDQLP